MVSGERGAPAEAGRVDPPGIAFEVSGAPEVVGWRLHRDNSPECV